MLKDNWEEKHGINLIQGTHVGNMVIQPLQGFSDNDHLAESSSTRNVAALTSSGSNLQDGRFGLSINQPTAEGHKSSIDSNLQDLVKFLSANYGAMKTPLEIGTPEYLKLVEILQQNSEINSKVGKTNNSPNVEIVNIVNKTDEQKLPIEKAPRVAAEKLWEGSLQLSSSVTLSAVSFFKSGEKLVGNIWPEFIEVKGKVRLEAFEKYVQDLPRSRNRGLMVISICWNEESSNIGLTGMIEVAKGYKKSCRVGFAQLLSGIDLYICPRSDPIITILAKYGFFKGMSVIDDKPDSMIGCVVWRKNRPVNPVGDTSNGKISPNSQVSEKKPSPEKLVPESSQHDEPLTLQLTTKNEVDHNGGNGNDTSNSSSSSSPLQNSISSENSNLVRKRPFEDDDLPEFDFSVACGKSTLVSQPLDHAISGNTQKLDCSGLNKNPSGLTSNGCSLEQSSKKTKLFDDDEDDMPEWCPPKLHNQLPPQTTTSNFQNLPSCAPRPTPPLPPLPPIPPPPRADTRSSFSYQPFRPTISTPPPTFPRPPPQPLPPPPPQPLPATLWRLPPGSFNVNPLFLSSHRRHPQL